MTEFLVKLASRVTANQFSQAQLRRLARVANYFRGLGCGATLEMSGEAAVFQMLQSSPVIFDVGANKGDFTRAILASHPDAIVHCFEPSKKTYQQLEKNLNGANVTLNNYGLGDQDHLLTLFSNCDGSGLASLSKRRLDHLGINLDREEIVQIRALDGYCREHKIVEIDLLKVDVEGHEMSVFKGAIHLLKSNRVRYVMFEFGGCNIDSRTFFQDFYYFFESLGVKSISRFTPSGGLVGVLKYSEDLEFFGTTNYLVQF